MARACARAHPARCKLPEPVRTLAGALLGLRVACRSAVCGSGAPSSHTGGAARLPPPALRPPCTPAGLRVHHACSALPAACAQERYGRPSGEGAGPQAGRCSVLPPRLAHVAVRCTCPPVLRGCVGGSSPPHTPAHTLAAPALVPAPLRRHIFCAVVGAGVLGLPSSVAWLGWVAGPICLCVFFAISLWSSHLLAQLYRIDNVEFAR